VAVRADERIRCVVGLVQECVARRGVVGVEVGEGLKPREADHQLADAARVLILLRVVGRVARFCGVREVQHGDRVAIGVFAEKRLEGGVERGVRGGDLEVRVIGQAQLDVVDPELASRGKDASLDFAGLGESIGFQAQYSGLLVGVQRIAECEARDCEQRECAHCDGGNFHG
jgi:hypothetical protein